MMVIIILPFHRDGEAHLQGILDTVKCHLLFSLSLFLRQLMTAPGSFFVIHSLSFLPKPLLLSSWPTSPTQQAKYCYPSSLLSPLATTQLEFTVTSCFLCVCFIFLLTVTTLYRNFSSCVWQQGFLILTATKLKPSERFPMFCALDFNWSTQCICWPCNRWISILFLKTLNLCLRQFQWHFICSTEKHLGVLEQML